MYAICVVISYWRGEIVNGCDNAPFMSIGMISIGMTMDNSPQRPFDLLKRSLWNRKTIIGIVLDHGQ